MSETRHTSLRFPLEESIWFESGQEVEELISISLDPNITIHEEDQLVIIRGDLELSGEYQPNEKEEDQLEFDETGRKYVQRVDIHEHGTAEFSHCFPLDITVPRNRLKHVDDVDVYVESFDYILPERSCLKLTAELIMTGIYEPADEKPEEQQQRESPQENIQETREKEEEETKEKEKEEETEETRLEIPDKEEMVVPEKSAISEEPSEDLETNKLFSENLREKAEPEPEEEELIESFTVEVRRTAKSEEEEETEQVNSSTELIDSDIQEERFKNFLKMPFQHKAESSSSVLEKETVESSSSLIIEESSSHEKIKEKKHKDTHIVEKEKKKKKDGISLAEFFARKEPDEAASMKVCIIQKGETLDFIAEKYDVHVQQILRVNRMETVSDLSEGQVIYIPQKRHHIKNFKGSI
ncbi:stage VI sporulation protein D [Bacillus chungangensis]|uniref:Stage VI sporulation protein D n=1 Tax=Bacillus chungangensis TaxID=587633 RepID=A0ABT9WM70_9BACI|nr:stage VI sporulation protein D [Bacillus chungangensis]MDQ0174336.1 stage VI sporulation protein D [Bacillus chungangensis]